MRFGCDHEKQLVRNRRRGYVVCSHVLEGVKPTIVRLAPADKGLGTVTCKTVEEHDLKTEMLIMCEDCVIEKGWLVSL